jgi:hypothetical protein
LLKKNEGNFIYFGLSGGGIGVLVLYIVIAAVDLASPIPLNTGLTKYRQSGAFAMDGSKAMSHGSLCGHGFSCMAMPHRNHG